MKLVYWVVVLFATFCLMGCWGESLPPTRPKGACVYGPAGIKACVFGTYEDECKENFKGSWHKGKTVMTCVKIAFNDFLNFTYVALFPPFILT